MKIYIVKDIKDECSKFFTTKESAIIYIENLTIVFPELHYKEDFGLMELETNLEELLELVYDEGYHKAYLEYC